MNETLSGQQHVRANKSQEKLLLVTRDFTPYCGEIGWMIRAVSMANYFSKEGYEVHVIAMRRRAVHPKLDVCKAVKCHWISNLFEEYKHDSQRRLIFLAVKLLQLVLNNLFKLIGRPPIDTVEYSLRRYKKVITRLIREENIGKVVISTPPHSLQTLVGWIKNKHSGVRVFSDMRDGWSIRPHYSKSKVQKQLAERMEATHLPCADGVIFVTEGMKCIYMRKLDLANVKLIENGYVEQEAQGPGRDFENIVRALRKEGRIIIGYFGSGELSNRNSEKNLASFFNVLSKNKKLTARFAVVLQGRIRCSPTFHTDVRYDIFDSAPNNETLGNMGLIDIGLNLNTDREYAPYVVGGKVYEYIGCEKPLLIVAHSNAVSLQALTKEGFGYFADIKNENGEIATTLHQIADDFDSGALDRSCKYIASQRKLFSRETQYARLKEIID